jgi:hypothetical protein
MVGTFRFPKAASTLSFIADSTVLSIGQLVPDSGVRAINDRDACNFSLAALDEISSLPGSALKTRAACGIYPQGIRLHTFRLLPASAYALTQVIKDVLWGVESAV